jgi:N-acetylgalactosamine-6-sulfatase
VNLWLHETHHLVSATDQDKAQYPDIPEPHRTYYGAVTRADRQVGRILEVLDELGIADDTIVIFSSDNGPENSHTRPEQKFYYSQGSTGGLRGRKRSLLMGGVNTPLLVRWPSVVPAGCVDKQTAIAGVDMFPTLLAAAGVVEPKGYVADGENMLPALKGQPQKRTKPVFWWWQGKHTGDDWPALAMRDGPWMLILDETKERAELYDVVADRQQARNRADEQPERVAQMRAAIDAWFASLPKQIDPALQTKVELSASAKKPAAGIPGKVDRGRVFQRWDTNNDGVLSLEEYRDGLTNKEDAETRFKNFDEDGDGKLSREEFVEPGTR